eukprot:2415886-Heterocapsa_arctica.AAC.1
MAKPKEESKARASSAKLGSNTRRDMQNDFGSTLGQQNPNTPRLPNRGELRLARFSPADIQRLSGGPGYDIGITWTDALKLAN